jgi:hypothetical protein
MAARVSSMFVRPGLVASGDQPITLDPNLVRTSRRRVFAFLVED